MSLSGMLSNIVKEQKLENLVIFWSRIDEKESGPKK